MVLSPPQTVAATANILVVEDEGIVAAQLASFLSKRGYRVETAESAEEAFTRISALTPQLVLMDIHIKGTPDGITTAVKLQERFDIPLIFLTAHTDQQTIERAKRTGAFGFLTKPIQHGSLPTAIEMAIYKHKAERETRQQRAWMATVLGTMADAMIVIDSRGKIQFLNGPAEELTEWRNAEAADREIGTVLPLRAAGGDRQESQFFSLESEPTYSGPLPRGLQARSRSGNWFPIEGEIAPSIDDGRCAGAVLTFRDGTARQAHENEIRQQRKMEAVGRLAAGVAHDFNNLLFVILGFTEEMLRTAHGTYRVALGEIKKAGDDAASITQQLLSYSRKDVVEMRNINLNEVIEETEELFRRLGGTSLTWQFKLDRNLGEVRADAGQLKQVLMNLVVNARDAMATGGKITIETANVEKPRPDAPSRERDQFVSVSVRDTGTGMSVETVEHLFEPFFTTKEPGRGTGLGLSIVHNIVRDLGGTIHVDSEKGRGSTFTVHLPRAASLAAVPPIEEATRAWPDDPPSVLIVENREKLRRIIGEHLTGSGYRIMEAADGEAALRLVSEHASNISLLVIGATVPPAGGFELAREIAATQDGVQAIFVSGYVQELADELEGAPAGASFLPRPFNVHELLSNVKALLEPKKAASMGASHSR